VLSLYISVRSYNSRTDSRRIIKLSGEVDYVISTDHSDQGQGHVTYQQLERYNSATEG